MSLLQSSTLLRAQLEVAQQSISGLQDQNAVLQAELTEAKRQTLQRSDRYEQRLSDERFYREQAEERITALDIQLRDADYRIAALEAENERLKCCGNCEHYDHMKRSYDPCEEECDSRPTDDTPYPEGYDHDESLFDGMNAWDSCHWTLSRWTAREEAGGANATRFAGQCWGGSDTPDERAREEAGDE